MGSCRFGGFSEYRWRRSPVCFLCCRRPLRCNHTMPGEILTSAESKECRGQGGGKVRSQPDTEPASWRLPKARADYRGHGNHGKSNDRSPRSQQNQRRRCLDVGSCSRQLPYHCAPDRFEGWQPSKLRTCSIVISMRILLKSTPGTVVPRSVTGRLGALIDRSVPFLSMGNGNGPLDRSVVPAAADSARARTPRSEPIKQDRCAGTSPGPNRGVSKLFWWPWTV